jgi:Adenylate cyclase, family 3 (some proteins contain HAMP domain)
MSEPAVFISYRRSDTGGHAGRLLDALRRRWGRENVFMDVDSIKPGEDWVKVVERHIGRCDALLALIGPDWLTATDAAGQQRLADPRDPLRLEIETALAADKPIIPILLGGVAMPAADALPESLRPLARRHAIRMSNETFDADLRALTTALRRIPRSADAADSVPNEPLAASAGESLTLTFLFTDLVGSTGLLQRIGEEKAQGLFQRHHEVLAKAVTDHGGTELEWLGDGIFASFASSSQAIRCALAMQLKTRRPIAGQALAIRIGVHTGEGMRRDGGYFGNAVVIARRLCDRAAAGQVLTTGFVASMLGGRAFEFRPIGQLSLSGIAQPVDTYEVGPGRGVTADAVLPADIAPASPSHVAQLSVPVPRVTRSWRRPAVLGVVALVVVTGSALVFILAGLLQGGGSPTGRAPLINGGSGAVTFDVGASACAASRNCFIYLLDAVSDPDGDLVTLDSAGSSVAGASVSVGSFEGRPVAHWTAPAGFVGSSDSFEFSVSDNHRNVVRGTCEVVDIPAP